MTSTNSEGRISQMWNAALLAVVGASLVTQLVLTLTGGRDANSGATNAGVPTLTRLVRLASYFTIESNVLVAVCCVTLLLGPGRDGRVWRVLRLDTLLGIAITGLVFAVLLAPKVHLHGLALAVTIGLHGIAPVATLVGWLLFGPWPRIDLPTVGRAFLWPAAWLGYTLAHGAATDWYPYPFLDVTELGYPRALINIAGVLAVALLLSFLLMRADAALARRHRRGIGEH
ncbi:Pr6Pr family membrane protein [Streptomyces sp. KL116D]|uniref:Pr6Pr family membrane protein n=1 Tax=Streptomyces sp. KL116D TaxID=3045152 RepID=UPI00355749AD